MDGRCGDTSGNAVEFPILAGGVGSIWGTVIGALIIGVMNNGLTILGLSSFWQYVAKGAVIVLAVLLDKWRQQQAAN